MGARDDLIAIPNDVLRRGDMAVAVLVWMDFAGSPRRWWAGWGDLSVGGHVWSGLGDLITMSEISTSYALTSTPLTFKMQATPEMIALAKAARSQVWGRTCIVYGQLFTAADQQLYGTPWALWSGTMQKLGVAAGGAVRRQLTLSCEGLATKRSSPPYGRLTDMDQRGRHPGDRGLERTPLYEGYEPRWA